MSCSYTVSSLDLPTYIPLRASLALELFLLAIVLAKMLSYMYLVVVGVL